MYRYLRLINVFLLIAIGAMGFKLYENWSFFHQKDHINGESRPEKNTDTRKNAASELAGLLKGTPDHSFIFYQEIVDKNLFREDRQGSSAKSEDSQDADELSQAAASHRFVLYGVAVVGNERRALIGFSDNDPASRGVRAGEKIRTVKVGDEIKDFKVDEIQESSIILSAHQESMTLNVYDPKGPRTRKSVRTSPTVRPAPVTPTPPVESEPYEQKVKRPGMPPGSIPVPPMPEDNYTSDS
jgi:hypothetical protein